MGDEQPVPLRDEVVRQLERTKWFLWHGNVFRAMQVLTAILFDLEMASFERNDGKISKLCKAVQESPQRFSRRAVPRPSNRETRASSASPSRRHLSRPR